MKKIILIISSLMSIEGVKMLCDAQITKAAHDGYTWREPFSDYEFWVLSKSRIGIALLVIGIIVSVIVGVYTVVQKIGKANSKGR